MTTRDPKILAQSVWTEAINWIESFNNNEITKKELTTSVSISVGNATDIILWYPVNMSGINKWHITEEWHTGEQVWHEATIALLDFANWLIEASEVKKRVLDVLNQITQ